MSKMSLQPNGAIIRASSVNACDAAESCLSAGNVSAALPHEEFFLEQVAGEGMSADGIIPLFSRGVSVLLFSRGKAEVRINGKSYSAETGTVATVIADEIVELENVSEDCVCAMVSVPSETVIDFPSPADSDILTMTMISPVFTVPGRKMALVMEYYRLMQTVNADRDNVFRWEIMKSIFYSMMLEICDAYRQYGTVVGKSELLRHEQLGDELFRLLSRHCRTHRSVSFYAGKLNITPKYLSREIKRITGRTVQEWVNRLTIMEMKKQLNVPGRTIMQISEDMEFSSPSAFVQFFKLHTGTTPLKYRKSAR
ncbi:MAG: AraC family transcriptional regulator [Bacteroidetes bacterium]|uniref:AraC family transcriptional regulator n=1 Tax=Candidatus Cryptobacteroides faecigallinarum TaxID=2840763 RepID=A0A9D9NI21_9BACT|nr:AraC family transcriptional regulator [Candidatus Cryptobacteroides faecigallinarum]